MKKMMRTAAMLAAMVLPLLFFACKNSAGSGDDDEEEILNQNSYVTAKATSEGIEFSGTIASNIFSDASSSSYLEAYDESGPVVSGNVQTSTSVTNKAKASIEITDCDSGVAMNYTFEKNQAEHKPWTLVYPLVEKGKTYRMLVTASWQDYTFYTEYFEIVAEGGIGEYIVTNADVSVPELTANRVIKKKVAPTFTKNPNVQIISQGTHYEIYRIDDTNDWLAWVYGEDIEVDNSTTGYPLKDVLALSHWKTYDEINAMLSGWQYRAQARTLLKIAGYSKVTFWMNDTESARGSWGGSKVKTLVVYGVDGHFTDANFKGDSITVSKMPGSSHEMTIDGEKKTFPYSQEVDYGITISEPKTIPSISGRRFTGWNVEFPCATHGTFVEQTFYKYMEICAEFE